MEPFESRRREGEGSETDAAEASLVIRAGGEVGFLPHKGSSSGQNLAVSRAARGIHQGKATIDPLDRFGSEESVKRLLVTRLLGEGQKNENRHQKGPSGHGEGEGQPFGPFRIEVKNQREDEPDEAPNPEKGSQNDIKDEPKE